MNNSTASCPNLCFVGVSQSIMIGTNQCTARSKESLKTHNGNISCLLSQLYFFITVPYIKSMKKFFRYSFTITLFHHYKLTLSVFYDKKLKRV